MGTLIEYRYCLKSVCVLYLSMTLGIVPTAKVTVRLQQKAKLQLAETAVNKQLLNGDPFCKDIVLF